MLVTQDPFLQKFQKTLTSYGVKSEVIENDRLDFEYDYRDISLLQTVDGIGNVGTLRIRRSSIDYFHIIKKKKLEKCEFAVGGSVGMGVHEHSKWKIRFLLAFPIPVKIGPLNFGTITTIKKGRFFSKVEDFVWNGYTKLTTLPPGLLHDNVADALYSDKELKELMKDCLLKERVITVSKYSPPELAYQKNATPTFSKIIIESGWKYRNDLVPNKKTLDMYERIASHVRKMIDSLSYHLK